MCIHAYGCYIGPGGETLDKRKLFAILAPLLIVVASAFAVTLAVNYAVAPVAATSPTQNVTLKNIGPTPCSGIDQRLHACLFPDHDCHDLCATSARAGGQGVEAHLSLGTGHVALSQ